MAIRPEYHAYNLIIEDYLQLCEFIEPCDNNLATYSHRTYELFLRTCTEIESLFKKLLTEYNYQKAIDSPHALNIIDYNKLYTEQGFMNDRIEAEVGLLFWRSEAKFITPFEDWVNGQSLTWYGSYNEVKHNRESSFEKANLGNLTLSISALFLLLYQKYGWGFFQPYSSSRSSGGGQSTGYSAQGCIFSVRGPGAGA